MKTIHFLNLLLTGYCLLGCKHCPDCDMSNAGPMISRIGVTTLKWIKAETPSGVLTPAQTGYDQQVLMMRRHVYTVVEDSLMTVRRIDAEEDSWSTHQFTLRYADNYTQLFELRFLGGDNTKELRQVIIHAPYRGVYNAKADTLLMYYENGGEVPKKYTDIENRSGF